MRWDHPYVIFRTILFSVGFDIPSTNKPSVPIDASAHVQVEQLTDVAIEGKLKYTATTNIR